MVKNLGFRALHDTPGGRVDPDRFCRSRISYPREIRAIAVIILTVLWVLGWIYGI